MTKAIRSYPEEKQAAVIMRRLNNSTKGMGTFAAQNAFAKANGMSADQARQKKSNFKKKGSKNG